MGSIFFISLAYTCICPRTKVLIRHQDVLVLSLRSTPAFFWPPCGTLPERRHPERDRHQITDSCDIGVFPVAGGIQHPDLWALLEWLNLTSQRHANPSPSAPGVSPPPSFPPRLASISASVVVHSEAARPNSPPSARRAHGLCCCQRDFARPPLLPSRSKRDRPSLWRQCRTPRPASPRLPPTQALGVIPP